VKLRSTGNKGQIIISVAKPEPEPVERKLFAGAGAGADVYWPGSGSG
jgi:hypothetical protein